METMASIQYNQQTYQNQFLQHFQRPILSIGLPQCKLCGLKTECLRDVNIHPHSSDFSVFNTSHVSRLHSKCLCFKSLCPPMSISIILQVCRAARKATIDNQIVFCVYRDGRGSLLRITRHFFKLCSVSLSSPSVSLGYSSLKQAHRLCNTAVTAKI